MGPRVKPHVFVASIVLLVAGLALVPSMSRAQDAASTPSMMQGMHQHPAHIHSGTCDTLGDVVYPLNDLTAPNKMSTPMAGMASTPMAGRNMGKVVAQSSTTIETSLDDLLGADYALNVHESAEKIDVYIACGDVKGTPTDNQLQIDLKELNNSGFQGMARLTDNGDGTTTVDAVLMESGHGMMGTPEATPSY
jgi:hypothetical protein